MNNSNRTTAIARGIYLWSIVQDQPALPQTEAHRVNVRTWKIWADENSTIVEFVKKEQFNLFDRVNAIDWSK